MLKHYNEIICVIKLLKLENVAKNKQKKENGFWMLFFDHFCVKTEFFILEYLLVCFAYLISSSQNFVIFSLKTDKAIKRSNLF